MLRTAGSCPATPIAPTAVPFPSCLLDKRRATADSPVLRVSHSDAMLACPACLSAKTKHMVKYRYEVTSTKYTRKLSQEAGLAGTASVLLVSQQ